MFEFKKKLIKFCIDCIWIGEGNYPNCMHPKALLSPEIDLVTGKLKNEKRKNCSCMRTWSSNCGKKGKYFECKEKANG